MQKKIARHLSRWVAFCIVSYLASTGLAAQETPGVANGQLTSEDGIDGILRHRRDLFQTSSLKGEVVSHWFRPLGKRGIEAVLTYDALAMGALNDEDEWGAASGDLGLSVRWHLNDADDKRPLVLAARLRDRHGIGGGLVPSELRGETGALWGYVDGFNDAGLEMPELYLQQRFFKKHLLVRYGQMAIDDLLDDHRMRSAKRSFLNQAFSSSPAVGLPGTGLGLTSRWTSPRGWDVTFAFSNIESTNLNDEADWSFDADALFQALQVGRDFKGLGGLPARLQILGWNADALPNQDLPSGRGASVTMEHKWPGGWGSFLRYAWSDGEAAPVSQLAAFGISRLTGDDELDRFGFAMAFGESSDESRRSQTSLELFYRHQIRRIHITPDVQVSFGDGIGGGRDWLLLAGLRVGMTF